MVPDPLLVVVARVEDAAVYRSCLWLPFLGQYLHLLIHLPVPALAATLLVPLDSS